MSHRNVGSSLSHGSFCRLHMVVWALGALLVLSIAILFTGCGSAGQELVASPTGGEAPLTVSFTNKSGDADQFLWDFGDGGNATTAAVDEPVVHEYTKAGTHTVTLTAIKQEEGETETSTSTTTIEVSPSSLAEAAIDPPDVVVAAGETLGLKIEGRDRYGNPIPDAQVSWELEEEVGTLGDDGTLTAGTVAGVFDEGLTIAAQHEGLSARTTASVTIVPGSIAAVTIAPMEVAVRETLQLEAIAADEYGNPILEAELTWDLAEEVGIIVGDGALVSGTVAGIFEDALAVTAAHGTASARGKASVTIVPGPVIAMTIARIELAVGETRQLEVVGVDLYGNPVSEVKAGGAVTWSMLDENAGRVTPTGRFTAGEVAGTYSAAVEARVTQEDETTIDLAPVTISAGPLAQVVLAPDPAEIGMGMTQQFVAVAADQYGNRITGLTIGWVVRNGGGSIDETGLFTAGTTPGEFSGTVSASATEGDTIRWGTADVTVEPDRIAFVSDRNDDIPEIYVMDADGTNIERLTTNLFVELFLSWSPDGRRIVFDGLFSDYSWIFAVNDDGTWFDTVTLTGDEMAPAWSPDGTRIAYMSWSEETESYEIFVVDVDGSNVTQITSTPGGDIYVPSWSPDGTKLAYDYTPEGQMGDIYVVNADGSNQRRLTTAPANDTGPIWSPDGSRIAFESEEDGDYEIYVMDANGGNRRQLTYNSGVVDGNPAWSPDGSRVVFVSDRDTPDTMKIYVMDADGSGVVRLTDDEALEISPEWAPPKRGVEVTEASVIIPDASTLKARTAQEVTAQARKAVVRIETDEGSGSGFMISRDGQILTNSHVVGEAEEVTVYLDSGIERTGTVQARDVVSDLALVKIEFYQRDFLELGDLSQVSLGDQVLVLGYPLGSRNVTVTSGLVSTIEYDSGRNITWVQTDSAINPGNSGGPMLNMQGQVIGVVSAKLVGLGIEGVGFAISANTVNGCLPELQAVD